MPEERVVGFVAAHVRPHRGSLGVSYGAAVVENTFELLYPFAIGLAVDGLLGGSWGGVTLFVLLSLAHTCLGVARQRYDTRLFNRMYASFATDLVEDQRAEGVATTSVVARTLLADEYVDFLRLSRTRNARPRRLTPDPRPAVDRQPDVEPTPYSDRHGRHRPQLWVDFYP